MVTVVFAQSGPIGLSFVGAEGADRFVIMGISDKSQASVTLPRLKVGYELLAVKGMPVTGKPFVAVMGRIKAEVRPIEMSFKVGEPRAPPASLVPTNPFMKKVTSPKPEPASERADINEWLGDNLANDDATESFFAAPSAALFAKPAVPTTRVVTVDVLAARGLRDGDTIGSSDPYVVVRCGKAEYRTAVIKNSVTPVWADASFVFKDVAEGAEVSVQVHDSDGGR